MGLCEKLSALLPRLYDSGSILNSLAGYAFARLDFKGKHVLFIMVLATMMIPFQVIMVPLFLEVYKMGMIM